MSFAAFHEAAKGVWGCFKISYDAEAEIGYRARLGGVWFSYGSGAGRTLDEACERALKRFEIATRALDACRATDEDLRNI